MQSRTPALKSATIDIPWYPQPVQKRVLRACGLASANGGRITPVADVIGAGGSAGGGKTDSLLIAGIMVGLMCPGANVALFRRTFPELDGPGGAIMRSAHLMDRWANYTEGKHRWTLPTGSVFQFNHCQKESDVTRYQSQQFDVLLIDEATHFTEYMVRYLITRNRATVDGLVPFTLLATNPGNVGHLWFKSQFVDPLPWGDVHDVVIEDEETERHVFVRAQLEDNRALLTRDPRYLNRLLAQPAKIRDALLYGKWDVFEGQFFDSWDKAVHVIKPVEIPDEWPRWRMVDWGYAAPFGCLWIARQPGTEYHVVYRERYGAGYTDPAQAEVINNGSPDTEKIIKTLADPSMWVRKTTGEVVTSTAEVYEAAGVLLEKANNDRISGWRRVRELMEVNPVSGRPNLQIFSTCYNLIRTLPAMIHDDTNVEDMDTDGEDHLCDALRYGLQERVNVRKMPAKQEAGRWDSARR